jgi:hypothetical protein
LIGTMLANNKTLGLRFEGRARYKVARHLPAAFAGIGCLDAVAHLRLIGLI